jgi:hypothetical protein
LNICGYRERDQVLADVGSNGADRSQILVRHLVEKVARSAYRSSEQNHGTRRS